MPKTTRQSTDSRRATVLRRVLAGRKRVSVARWQWQHPQAITTLQRVPLPPQRLLPGRRLEHAVMRFSEFVEMLDEHNGE
jgi:hypothetical protein